jgi:hypothetical protein
MKASNTIAIGVMSQGKLRERVLAIARGDCKPKASDPKIWFTSMKSAASVLSDESLTLLRTNQWGPPINGNQWGQNKFLGWPRGRTLAARPSSASMAAGKSVLTP